MKKTKREKDALNEQSVIRQDIRRLGAMIEGVNENVKLVAEQYGGIKKTLDSHTEMIGAMKEDVEIIKTDIEFIKGSLKKKVDYEEFAALERRISLVETKLRR